MPKLANHLTSLTTKTPPSPPSPASPTFPTSIETPVASRLVLQQILLLVPLDELVLTPVRWVTAPRYHWLHKTNRQPSSRTVVYPKVTPSPCGIRGPSFRSLCNRKITSSLEPNFLASNHRPPMRIAIVACQSSSQRIPTMELVFMQLLSSVIRSHHRRRMRCM